MQEKQDSADLVTFKYLLDELPDGAPAKAAATLKLEAANYSRVGTKMKPKCS